MTFTVHRTQAFVKLLNKLPKSVQEAIILHEIALSQNPFIGKPLSYIFLREKKLSSRRIYYHIYEEDKMVLMVMIGDKKNQKEIIEYLKKNRDYYLKIIQNLRIRSNNSDYSALFNIFNAFIQMFDELFRRFRILALVIYYCLFNQLKIFFY